MSAFILEPAYVLNPSEALTGITVIGSRFISPITPSIAFLIYLLQAIAV